ncbi:MAG: hypothetical protein E7360_02100 [Clostridiales bacterium]|nr:hypothetical protein [Clostridiales bacterium]
MKKFFKSLVAIMLVAMTAIAFTSCGIPSDYKKAEANLKEEGYEVMVLTDAITLGSAEALYGLERGDLVASVTGMKDDDGVSIFYCADKDAANTLYDKLKAEFDEADDEEKEDSDFGKSGKVVWAGTKAGVKAAK